MSLLLLRSIGIPGKYWQSGKMPKGMLGRTPDNITAVRPLLDGVISDYDIAERMLKHFIKKSCGTGRFFRPKMMVCVPSDVTEVERRAVSEAAMQAGGKTGLPDAGTCGSGSWCRY